MKWGISSETSYFLEGWKQEDERQERHQRKLRNLLIEVSNWPRGMPQRSAAMRLGHEREGDVDFLLMFGLVDETRDPKLGDKRYHITRKGRDELGRFSPPRA